MDMDGEWRCTAPRFLALRVYTHVRGLENAYLADLWTRERDVLANSPGKTKCTGLKTRHYRHRGGICSGGA